MTSETQATKDLRATLASADRYAGLVGVVNAMTTEQYLRLLDIADPNPPTAEERAEAEALTDDQLLAELLA
jgi:hypothetical protein